MKKTYLFGFIVVLLCFVSVNFVSAQSNVSWKLVFEDNFDGTTFDANSWSYCPRRTSDWNKYLVSSDKTVQVKDGNLHLYAIVNTDLSTDNVPYLTGGVKTEGKFSIKYGKVEVRARFTGQGQGAWPAIWMMPDDGSAGWPACGEIDIMEHLNKDNFIYQTIHSNYANTLGIKDNPKNHVTCSFNVNEYNVYGLEWTPDKMDFTVNGTVKFTYPRTTTDKAGQWPFNKSFYLILNQAAGGSWVGNVNNAELPFEMEVDWVKMYQLDKKSDYITPVWSSSLPQNDTRWKNTYVKTITSTNVINPVNYSSASRPSSYYVLYPDTLKVNSQASFSLNLAANSLGNYTESTVLQDLRYTCLYSFQDLDNNKFFELSQARIGNVPPQNGVGGNFNVLNAVLNFTAPYAEKDTIGRVRVIYSNAWSDINWAESSVKEGIMYDFNVKILSASTRVNQTEFKPVIYTKNNTVFVKELEKKCFISVYDFTGKMLQSFKNSDNSFSFNIPQQNVIIRIINPRGTQYSTKLFYL